MAWRRLFLSKPDSLSFEQLLKKGKDYEEKIRKANNEDKARPWIDADLIFYLIQLNKLQSSHELHEDKKKKLECIAGNLFFHLVLEVNFPSVIIVLKQQISPEGIACAFEDKKIVDFYNLLTGLDNWRRSARQPDETDEEHEGDDETDEEDEEDNEIKALFLALEQRQKNSSKYKSPIPMQRGDTRLIERQLGFAAPALPVSLKRDNTSLIEDKYFCMDSPQHQSITEPKLGLDFRIEQLESNWSIDPKNAQVFSNHKIQCLTTIFTDYKTHLQKSWIYTGKKEKKDIVQQILDTLEKSKDSNATVKEVKKIIEDNRASLAQIRQMWVVSAANATKNKVNRGVSGFCSLFRKWGSSFDAQEAKPPVEKPSHGRLAVDDALCVIDAQSRAY